MTLFSAMGVLVQTILVKIVLNRIAKNEANVRYKVHDIKERNRREDQDFEEQVAVNENDEIHRVTLQET
jgi:hypothetical protein